MITVGLYGIPDPQECGRPTHTHDHGVALMRDGRVLTVVQLERWTGRKHDNRLPRYISEILESLLPPDEPVRFVSVNSFVGSGFASEDGNLEIVPRGDVPVSADIVQADVRWLPDGQHQRPAEGWVVCHELAHVASLLPFIGAFQDDALAVHIDGGASSSACSFWSIEGGRPKLREASWDLLKDVVNNFNVNPAVRAILGLAPDDHLAIPGRLMGFAGLGTPTDELDTWLRPQRWLLEASDAEVRSVLRSHLGEIGVHSHGCQDLCATLQRAFESRVVEQILIRAPAHRTKLYLAGGAALNIPTNALLQHEFDEVWVPPATNDSGLALGAAAWVEYLERGQLPVHDAFLNRFGVPTDEPDLGAIEAVAARVLRGDVIGVCNGAAELGPRALGHRSIIARTDSPDIRVRVSEHIKQREWYRPIAPVLCEEAAAQVLDETAVRSPLSRWMLGSWRVRNEWCEHLAGVLHRDGTVRAQVVRNDGTNTWLHVLLTALWRRHGLPALINTSFNGPGRPIVHGHADAQQEAQTLGLDHLVVHGSLHRP